MPAPHRVRWKCRRGMREMDILLTRFLDRGYDALDDAGRATFDRLLDMPDQDIFDWLSGGAVPDDAALASLITHMRTLVQGPPLGRSPVEGPGWSSGLAVLMTPQPAGRGW